MRCMEDVLLTVVHSVADTPPLSVLVLHQIPPLIKPQKSTRRLNFLTEVTLFFWESVVVSGSYLSAKFSVQLPGRLSFTLQSGVSRRIHAVVSLWWTSGHQDLQPFQTHNWNLRTLRSFSAITEIHNKKLELFMEAAASYIHSCRNFPKVLKRFYLVSWTFRDVLYLAGDIQLIFS